MGLLEASRDQKAWVQTHGAHCPPLVWGEGGGSEQQLYWFYWKTFWVRQRFEVQALSAHLWFHTLGLGFRFVECVRDLS